MASSCAVFGLNPCNSGLKMQVRFFHFHKTRKCAVCGYVFYLYNVPCVGDTPTHVTFPSFVEMDYNALAFSLQIYDYLCQIQRETKAFLLIVRHRGRQGRVPEPTQRAEIRTVL